MRKESKIYVAGHTGLVGSALMRKLKEKGYKNIITRTMAELDLTRQQATADFFEKEKPDYVFLAAARVGGIVANTTYRAQFIYENLQIQNNIIHHSYLQAVKKLLFLGSSCVYPKNAPQPLKEEYLLTSELEYTNEPYAIAKIAGIIMCESYNIQYGTNFICAMPTNLYGPNDNYNLETSHVLPAMLRKFHLGKCLENNDWITIRKDLNKRPVENADGNVAEGDILSALFKYGIKKAGNTVEIELWGSGKPSREFLHTDDVADACIYLMDHVDFKELAKPTSQGPLTLIPRQTSNVSHPASPIQNTHINIGAGQDLQINKLADLMKDITGFAGNISWNLDKPDGTPRKLMDVGKINKMGWKANISLKAGVKMVYNEYLCQLENQG